MILAGVVLGLFIFAFIYNGGLPNLSMLTGLVTAQESLYSLDISGLKTEDYAIGSVVKFKVIILEGTKPISRDVKVIASDALEKKVITIETLSDKETTLPIDSDFPSGLWNLKAVYGENEVTRNFNVGENEGVEFSIEGVEFSIEGDELIIKNNGNVRYTRTIQITIGSVVNSYAQNIRIGEEKRLKLVSPKGIYNIIVTDGQKTLRKENIELFGTGNVIGAVDKDLIGYTGLVGVGDPKSQEERFFSLNRLPISLAFIASVGILAVLVFVERRIAKKRKAAKK